MSKLQTPSPTPEGHEPGEVGNPSGIDAMDAQAKEIFKGLREKGVDFLVLEGLGYQFFLHDVNMIGEVVATRTEELPDPDGGEAQKVLVMTVRNADSSRDFQINGEIVIEEGQTVSVYGVANYFINGAEDFIGGVSREQRADRLKSLRDMLNDRLSAVALAVSAEGTQIYNDREASEQIRELRAGGHGVREMWNELLAEFQ